MSFTPLRDALRAYAAREPARFHMPGHKGRARAGFPPEPLDVTELGATGDLYAGAGLIAESEALAAEVYTADGAYYLTGGATQGILASLALAASPGARVLVDRNCHRSVVHALILLDLDPVFIYPETHSSFGITLGVDPAALETALAEAPDVAAAIVTSPTYYGVLSDVAALAAVCARRGVPLIVDAAHGAHLPFLAGFASPAAEGAALAVLSAHKTLPALGQSALLLADRRFAPESVRRATRLFGTSSPSFPLLVSIEAALAAMRGETGSLYGDAADAARCLARDIDRETPFRTLCSERGLRLDPCRLVLNTAAGGLGGRDAARRLEDAGAVAEMADARSVVFIVTAADFPENLDRLRGAIFDRLLPQARATASAAPLAAPPAPERIFSTRRAYFSPQERIPLAQAAGRVAADAVAPFPPGVPVLLPGEKIGQKTLAFLAESGYNTDERVPVLIGPKPAPPEGNPGGSER